MSMGLQGADGAAKVSVVIGKAPANQTMED